MSTLPRHVCYQCLVICQKDQLFVSVLANLYTYCDWNLFFDSGRISTNSLWTVSFGLPSSCVSRCCCLPSWSFVTVTVCGGGNLGLVYNLLLRVDHLYSSPIDDLHEKVRTKVSPRCIGVSNGWFCPLTFTLQNHLSDDF